MIQPIKLFSAFATKQTQQVQNQQNYQPKFHVNFATKPDTFERTSNRHDYALKPTGPTVLNAMKDKGLDVIGVGKINDIFCGEGNTETYHSTSSVNGMEQTI